MAKKATAKSGTYDIDLGRPNSAPQGAYFESRAKYNMFGGARGG